MGADQRAHGQPHLRRPGLAPDAEQQEVGDASRLGEGVGHGDEGTGGDAEEREAPQSQVVNQRGQDADVDVVAEVGPVAVGEAAAVAVVEDDGEVAGQRLIEGAQGRDVPDQLEVAEPGG